MTSRTIQSLILSAAGLLFAGWLAVTVSSAIHDGVAKVDAAFVVAQGR